MLHRTASVCSALILTDFFGGNFLGDLFPYFQAQRFLLIADFQTYPFKDVLVMKNPNRNSTNKCHNCNITFEDLAMH